MVDKLEIRKNFEAFVGKDRYSSFLETIQHSNSHSGRLKYKQEIEWDSFVEKNALPPLEYPEIWKLFQYCYLHDCEFKEDSVGIIYGTRRSPSEKELKFSSENYPHANLVAYGPCWVEEAKVKKVMYCEKCRENFYKIKSKA